MEVSFYSFAGTRKNYTGCESVVDVCLHAMEEGTLSLTANQWEKYLWEYFSLTPDQLAHVCALLQLQRLPASFALEMAKQCALDKAVCFGKSLPSFPRS